MRKTEVNIEDVSPSIGMDGMIGKSFLKAGLGFRGSCFPKDVSALIAMAEEFSVHLQILTSVIGFNEGQKKWPAEIVKGLIGLEGKRLQSLAW